jgi:hypothetical protein
MRPYRSLFWPILLIGVGLVWLLGNFNLIPDVSLISLLRLWPVLLIVAGLDLLFGRSSALVGGLIGLLAVAFIIVVLVAGPSLGLANQPELISEQFSAPLDDATSASVLLDLGSTTTRVHALNDTDQLISADIEHFGQMTFDVTGTDVKRVRLASQNISFNWFDTIGSQPRMWDIALSPEIPLDLTVDSGSGAVDMDLSALQLNDVRIDSGSGSVELSLPEGQAPYQVEIESGSGSVGVEVPCGPGIRVELDGGSGSRRIDVDDNCPLRVEVRDGGSGSINLPGGLDRISGDSDEDEGVWESEGYDENEAHILIYVSDQGSGSLNVR